MAKIALTHYCQYCNKDFYFVMDELETGNRGIVCPTENCRTIHRRHFRDGNCEFYDYYDDLEADPPIYLDGKSTKPRGIKGGGGLHDEGAS